MSDEFYSDGDIDVSGDLDCDVTDDIESDVTDGIENDATDNIESDIMESVDIEESVDDMLNNMSLDELYELRDSLTQADVEDGIVDMSDLQAVDEDIEQVEISETDIPDISDLPSIDEEKVSDYSYHWDGGPTHNTEWDDETEPTTYTKKLTR